MGTQARTPQGVFNDWSNGREYYVWHGKKLAHLPGEQHLRPERDFLQWHNENRFKS
jgi:putative restriction endonuclease